jgi:hypothetical protein
VDNCDFAKVHLFLPSGTRVASAVHGAWPADVGGSFSL